MNVSPADDARCEGKRIAYPHLFSPLALGSLTLKNRVVMSPMSTEMGGEDGSVTPRMIAFYRERALGGVGLITVEYTCVDPDTGRASPRQLTLEGSANLPGHIELIRTLHDAGAHVFMQIQHSGQYSNAALLPGGMAVGPSDVFTRRDPKRQIARAMTGEEIERMIEAFGKTAEMAVVAGYDGVELHGAHGYLLTQFLSPFGNHRQDRWGSDFEGRLRFPCAVINRVKAAIGNRPLSFRISADEFTPGGLTIADMEMITPHLAAAGADLFHISTGWGVGAAFATVIEPMSTAEGWRIPLAERIRRASGKPVIAVGQIRWPETAEAAIAAGQADLIALGRPMLADPYWANKAMEGRRDAIRPCTSCNWCVAAHDEDGVGCAENPRTGFERDPRFTPEIGAGRKAVVVGAGPGGISAALMLEKAGFETHLYERRDRVGGGLIASAAPPGKDKLSWYKDYLTNRLGRSAVRVHLCHAATIDEVITLDPTIVIIAAGTMPHQTLPIEGLDEPLVSNAFDVLMGDVDPDLPEGGHVVIYGGGETGCETAEHMATKGMRVTLVTRSPADKLARSAEFIYRTGLVLRIRNNPTITLLQNSRIARINGRTIWIEGEHAGALDADRVLIAQGRQSDPAFAAALSDAGISCTVIGDSRKVGRIGDAVHMAYKAVQSLRHTTGPLSSQRG